MKRFYCETCGKVKRVRKYPVDIVTPSAPSPMERRGNCDRHTAPRDEFARVNAQFRVRKTGTR